MPSHLACRVASPIFDRGTSSGARCHSAGWRPSIPCRFLAPPTRQPPWPALSIHLRSIVEANSECESRACNPWLDLLQLPLPEAAVNVLLTVLQQLKGSLAESRNLLAQQYVTG